MTKIEKLFAILSSEEGICAQYRECEQSWFPMVSADKSKIVDLAKVAQDMADQTGESFRLAEFTVRKDIKYIEPTGKKKKH